MRDARCGMRDAGCEMREMKGPPMLKLRRMYNEWGVDPGGVENESVR